MSQNKNIIIAISVLLIALGALGWVSKPARNAEQIPQQNSSLVVLDEPAFDFGAISMAAGNVLHSYRIKNSKSDPLTINRIYTSCMCTTAKLKKGGKSFGPFGMPGHGFTPYLNATFAPGEEATIEAIFNPAAHGPAGVGKIERAVYIEDASGGITELSFKTLVTP